MANQSAALGRIQKVNKRNRHKGWRFSIPQLEALITELKKLEVEGGHDDPYFDQFEKATGVVFMLGSSGGLLPSYSVEAFPVVGSDENNEPKWDFVIKNGKYGYTDWDGGGGGNQKTPPPFPKGDEG